MLRKTPEGLERLQPDGTWEKVESQEEVGVGIAEEADALLEVPGTEQDNSTTPVQGSEVDNTIVTSGEAVERIPGGVPSTVVGPSQNGTDVLDIEVPGLLSTDGRKGTSGQRRLARLRQRAQSKVGKVGTRGSRISARGRAAPREIVVPSSAAEVTGPDAQLGRGDRKPGGVAGRIVTRETPTLLEGRPKWVRDLFEAHFRSELALTLRRTPTGKGGKNRMKLSRADYAIGWLVCFDKAREDPGILRLK